MLKNNLYTIEKFEAVDDRPVVALIRLRKDHPVFEGHFPGNPILPGVCTIQIIKELLEKAFNSDLQLTRASNIKYLGFINPEIHSEILTEITFKTSETGYITCSAMVSAAGNIVCSFKGEFNMV
jgi:3-hydroxyacyl-[acyl-carrier-protein] dehydratase